MEIECSFVVDSSQGYSCKVVEASIVNPCEDIVSFKGYHKPGKNNNDVTRIVFIKAKVEYFPRNLQNIFPNLNDLGINGCDLKGITRQDLIGLEKLVELDLSYNRLKSLPDDLFENMPNLIRVYLSHNKVEFASSKLIEPIVKNQLEYFDLRSNTSIDENYLQFINVNLFGTCKTIQELMTKIDKQCKPPDPRVTSNALHNDSSRVNAEKEILKSMNEYRRLGLYTDFVIIVGSKEFPVNKIILASQSSVFAEMFKIRTNGRFASKLEISEISQQAVETFLDYLYERKQPDNENAAEIFMLAAKYDVIDIKAICEEIICESLDKSNAFEIFKLAFYKSEELKIAAFRKLQETFEIELDEDLMNDPKKTARNCGD